MYAIRVGAGGEVLEAVFSADVPAAEALRALSQASVLAEAGGIAHAFCDVREVDGGLTHGSLQVIAASFHGRSAPDQRVAVVCNQRQLPLARRCQPRPMTCPPFTKTTPTIGFGEVAP